ncbi:MAG: lipopolysaccharide biosynthesis protein [Balneolaceae bacterium]
MGIVIKQSFYNAIISYIGIGLGFVTTILLYPHIFSPEQYGLTRVLISASMIGTHFAHLGFRNLIFRFHPLFKKISRDNHGLLFWSVLIPFAGFLLFAAIYWFFRDFIISYYADESPLFVEFYIWVLPITFFMLYFEILNTYLRSLRDSVTGSIASDIILRLITIIILILYFFELISFQTFILLFTAGYGLQILIIIAAIHKLGDLNLKPNFSVIRKKLALGMTSYGLYTLFGGLTTVVVWNVDILMLSSLTGLEQTAVYAIAFYVGSVIAVPAKSIEKITTPLIADFIKEKKWDEIEQIYKKSALNQFLGGFFVFALIWINLDFLFLLLPDPYAAGKWVIIIIGIGKLVMMATGTNGAIIITSNLYRVDLYTNVFLVIITIYANLLLIPPYGITGAAVATTLSITLYNLIKTVIVHVKMKMHPLTPEIVKALFIGSGSLTISLIIPVFFKGFWILIPVNLLFLVIFLIPVYKLQLSPDANNLLNKISGMILKQN